MDQPKPEDKKPAAPAFDVIAERDKLVANIHDQLDKMPVEHREAVRKDVAAHLRLLRRNVAEAPKAYRDPVAQGFPKKETTQAGVQDKNLAPAK